MRDYTILKESINTIAEFKNAFDAMNSAMGIDPNSKLFDLLFHFYEPYIVLLAELYDDTEFKWIDWFINENDLGRNRFDVMIGGDKRFNLTTVDDLILLLEEEYRTKKG